MKWEHCNASSKLSQMDFNSKWWSPRILVNCIVHNMGKFRVRLSYDLWGHTVRRNFRKCTLISSTFSWSNFSSDFDIIEWSWQSDCFCVRWLASNEPYSAFILFIYHQKLFNCVESPKILIWTKTNDKYYKQFSGEMQCKHFALSINSSILHRTWSTNWNSDVLCTIVFIHVWNFNIIHWAICSRAAKQ